MNSPLKVLACNKNTFVLRSENKNLPPFVNQKLCAEFRKLSVLMFNGIHWSFKCEIVFILYFKNPLYRTSYPISLVFVWVYSFYLAINSDHPQIRTRVTSPVAKPDLSRYHCKWNDGYCGPFSSVCNRDVYLLVDN